MSSPESCTNVLVTSNKLPQHDSSQDIFICSFCEKTFDSQSKIIEHFQNRSLKFTCIKCNVSFCSRQNILKHCALNPKCKPICGKQALSKTKSKKVEKLYSCNVCNKELSSKQSLNEHMFSHNPEMKMYNCKKCDKSFATSYRLVEHELSHKKKYVCKVCKSHFNRRNNYLAHIRSHESGKVYMCPVCNKTFTKLGNMNRHMDVHSTEKKFDCKFCNKKFNHSSNLYRHEQDHSKGKENLTACIADDVSSNSSESDSEDFNENLFKCDMCKKTFKYKQYLSRHMNIHLNENSFKCKYCEKSFTFFSTLKQHLNIHEKKIDYNCQFCNKSFKWARSLRRHITCHKDKKK